MGSGGGTGSPQYREHTGAHIDELVLVTSSRGAGGGGMTGRVWLVEEHPGGGGGAGSFLSVDELTGRVWLGEERLGGGGGAGGILASVGVAI